LLAIHIHISANFEIFSKINLQKLVNICGYELPTNMEKFTQKDLTKVKIFKKNLGWGRLLFLKNRVYVLNQGIDM